MGCVGDYFRSGVLGAQVGEGPLSTGCVGAEVDDLMLVVDLDDAELVRGSSSNMGSFKTRDLGSRELSEALVLTQPALRTLLDHFGKQKPIAERNTPGSPSHFDNAELRSEGQEEDAITSAIISKPCVRCCGW